jgi:hypothetical protein
MTRRVPALAAAGLVLLATAGCGGHHAAAQPVPKAKTLIGRTDSLDAGLRSALMSLTWPAKAQGLDGVAPVPSGTALPKCTAAGTGRNAVQLSVTVALPDAKKLSAEAPALASALGRNGWTITPFKTSGAAKTAGGTDGDATLTLTDGLAQLFLLAFTPCASGTPVTQNATPTLLKLKTA